jgi:hypothetical protein
MHKIDESLKVSYGKTKIKFEAVGKTTESARYSRSTNLVKTNVKVGRWQYIGTVSINLLDTPHTPRQPPVGQGLLNVEASR